MSARDLGPYSAGFMRGTPVSIILRSCNEAWALRETLPALRAQSFTDWELIVIDSGSNDGSVDLIRRAAPRHFLQILPEDYQPGRVLNAGLRLARGACAVFLNADATPQGPHWLAPLVAALAAPGTAAVFSRQIPRPGCRATFALDYARSFGPGPAAAGGPDFFSLASSAIQRDLWARLGGFSETLQYSEDVDYALRCARLGHRIAYCPASVAMHSHNYTAPQAYKRSFGEACALGLMPGPRSSVARSDRVFAGWLNDLRRDLVFCLRARRVGEWPHAWRTRWAQRTGRRDGTHAGLALSAAKATP